MSGNPVPVAAISTAGTATVSAIGSNGTGGGKIMSAAELRAAAVVYSTAQVDALIAAIDLTALMPKAGGTFSGPITGTSGVIKQRDGLTAQVSQIFATYTSDSSLEAMHLDTTTSGFLRLSSVRGSSGGSHRDFRFDSHVSGSAPVEAIRTWLDIKLDGYEAILVTPTSSSLVFSPSAGIQVTSAKNTNIGIGRSSFGRDGAVFEPITSGSVKINFRQNWGYDQAVRDLEIEGAGQYSGAVTNLIGGRVIVSGGVGSSGSAGNAHGGDVIIRGGTGYGTGRSGLVIFERIPSSITLASNGQFSIEMTSNTAGNLVYRGSDGTTRRMALTFA